MTRSQIKEMSMIERLQTMEELWGSICEEEKEMESPEWHRDILDERRKKIESGEATFISLDELKARFNR